LDKLSKIVAIFEQSAPLIANKQQDKDNQDLKSKSRFFYYGFYPNSLGIPINSHKVCCNSIALGFG
jgi:hypothetical protein